MARMNYINATLQGADLSNKDLDGSNFQQADLTDALLIGASLRNCDFTGANLERAVLAFADVEGAVFADCNFKDAILFDTTALVSGGGPDIFEPENTGPIRAIVLNQFDGAFATLAKNDHTVSQYLELLATMGGFDMFEVDTPFVQSYDNPEYVTISGFGGEDNQAVLARWERTVDSLFTAVISQNDHPLRMLCGFAWMTEFVTWKSSIGGYNYTKRDEIDAVSVGSTLIDCTFRFLSKSAAAHNGSWWGRGGKYDTNLTKHLRCAFKPHKSRGWLPLNVAGGSFEDCSFTALLITGCAHVESWVVADLEHVDKGIAQWVPTFSNVHKVEFRECVFKNVEFAGVDFANTRFIDCVFEGRCTFRNCRFEDTQAINSTGMKNVTLYDTKGQTLTIIP